MNDKVTLQAISDLFARQYGISKKTTDAFGKAFFDTIVDGLNKDGAVKIKGLGTFKIVEVGSRESVNVTNGERIVIDGYRKVTFVPDELAEQKKKEAVEHVENTVAQATEEALKAETLKVQDVEKENVEAKANIVELQSGSAESVEERAAEEVSTRVSNEGGEPNVIEVPADEFSGIDLLISTPESIMEVEKDLEAARVRAEKALEEAKQANIEYRRLELLLDRLKSNVAPEVSAPEATESAEADEIEKENTVATAALAAAVDNTPITEPLEQPAEDLQAEPAESVTTTGCEENTPAESEEVATNEAEENTPADTEEDTATDAAKKTELTDIPKKVVEIGGYEDDEEETGRKTPWLLILLIAALLAAVGIFAYRYMKYDMPTVTTDKTDTTEKPEKPEKEHQNVPDTITRDTAVIMDDSDVRLDAEALKATQDKEREEKEAAKNAEKEKMEAERAAEKEKKEAERAAEKEKREAERAAEKAEKDKRAAERDAQKATNRPKSHVVATGENLYRISRKYYGTNDSVKAIIRVNKIADPNNVTVGTEIKLP